MALPSTEGLARVPNLGRGRSPPHTVNFSGNSQHQDKAFDGFIDGLDVNAYEPHRGVAQVEQRTMGGRQEPLIGAQADLPHEAHRTVTPFSSHLPSSHFTQYSLSRNEPDFRHPTRPPCVYRSLFPRE